MGVAEDALAIHEIRGVSQKSLLEELVELGAPPRSQSSISRYLNGRLPVPADLEPALREYVQRHRQFLGDGDPAGRDAQVVPLRAGRHATSMAKEPGAARDVRHVVMARVLRGPPLSKWDYKALALFAGAGASARELEPDEDQ